MVGAAVVAKKARASQTAFELELFILSNLVR